MHSGGQFSGSDTSSEQWVLMPPLVGPTQGRGSASSRASGAPGSAAISPLRLPAAPSTGPGWEPVSLSRVYARGSPESPPLVLRSFRILAALGRPDWSSCEPTGLLAFMLRVSGPLSDALSLIHELSVVDKKVFYPWWGRRVIS